MVRVVRDGEGDGVFCKWLGWEVMIMIGTVGPSD